MRSAPISVFSDSRPSSTGVECENATRTELADVCTKASERRLSTCPVRQVQGSRRRIETPGLSLSKSSERLCGQPAWPRYVASLTSTSSVQAYSAGAELAPFMCSPPILLRRETPFIIRLQDFGSLPSSISKAEISSIDIKTIEQSTFETSEVWPV